MTLPPSSLPGVEGPLEEGEDDSLPLYLQIMSSLRISILRGLYPVGSRIPTEIALCARFNVSRHTIREALRHLRADGLITSQPGERPVVAAPSLSGEQERLAGRIVEDIFDYVIGTRLHIEAMEMVRITPTLAVETGLPPDELWLCVKGYRTNVDDGVTTCWNEYYINSQYATMGRLLMRHVGPLLSLLEDMFDVQVVRLARTVSAILMPTNHAAQFRVASGAPALSILTRCETADRRVALLHKATRPGGVIFYSIGR